MLSPDLIEQARAIDLLAFAGRHVALKRVAATAGGEYASPCPLCGGRDRFRVQPARGRWLCRHCTPRWDDAIALEMRLSGSSFPDAVRTLTAGAWPAVSLTPAPPDEKPAIPNPAWQKRAQRLVTQAAQTLWQSEGQAALAWLKRRGLNAETLRRWKIGCLPRPRTEGGKRWGLTIERVAISAGVLIPGFTANGLTYLKVRRLASAPKYVQVRGSRPSLYLAETITPETTHIAVCEGEFDALLLWQCLQLEPALREVAVVTPGSQSPYPRSDWAALITGRRLLLLFHQDEAGRQGACRWLTHFPDALALTWPAKDLTDYHLAGGSLPALIETALSRNAHVSPNPDSHVLSPR